MQDYFLKGGAGNFHDAQRTVNCTFFSSYMAGIMIQEIQGPPNFIDLFWGGVQGLKMNETAYQFSLDSKYAKHCIGL